MCKSICVKTVWNILHFSTMRKASPPGKGNLQRATTVVRTVHGKTGQFEIEVGLHQGSGLSQFLITIVLDTISEECRNGLPR